VDTYRARWNWTDENNRPLLCELEDGVVRTFKLALLLKKGTPFFWIHRWRHIVEGGIFMHIKKRSFEKLKVESKFDVPIFDDTYYSINISHLQTAFYLLMLGFVLAVACLVTEIMWYIYSTKVRGPTGTALCHGKT
jgi:hypothetical protein